MIDPFTTKQKVEKLFGKTGGATDLLFPCPICGHRNKPKGSNLDRVKRLLKDTLPKCKKCGKQLNKKEFDRSTIPISLLNRALRDLESKNIIKCRNCEKEMKVPTDRGKIKVTCPGCLLKFNFTPAREGGQVLNLDSSNA